MNKLRKLSRSRLSELEGIIPSFNTNVLHSIVGGYETNYYDYYEYGEYDEYGGSVFLLSIQPINSTKKSLFIPIGVTEVKVSVSSQYALDIITGKYSVFGVEKTFTIPTVAGSGSVTLDLAASNTNMSIEVSHSCSSCSATYSVSYQP